MQREELLARLDAHPRLPLACYPTPLDPLTRLSQELGRPLFIKRDDLLGPALGGNKTRKLEYLLADAKRREARKVVTFGGLQSNHARLTAAAARMLGFEPHLLYFDRKPDRLAGNLLLNQLLGARMHFIPLGPHGGGMSLESTIRFARLVAWMRVGPHYFIPVGGHSWLGGLGYVRAALELAEQAEALGLERARVVMAAGSGGTLAGVWAGLRLLGSPLRPLGLDVGRLFKGFAPSVARLAGELCARLGAPQTLRPEDVPLLEGTYAAPAYGVPSEAGRAALERLARTEGILLDPVYTAKAFAGLLDLLDRGVLGSDEPLIFLHTGGLPALFAFESAWNS
jgi:D-cysteine desulfhydrase